MRVRGLLVTLVLAVLVACGPASDATATPEATPTAAASDGGARHLGGTVPPRRAVRPSGDDPSRESERRAERPVAVGIGRVGRGGRVHRGRQEPDLLRGGGSGPRLDGLLRGPPVGLVRPGGLLPDRRWRPVGDRLPRPGRGAPGTAPGCLLYGRDRLRPERRRCRQRAVRRPDGDAHRDRRRRLGTRGRPRRADQLARHRHRPGRGHVPRDHRGARGASPARRGLPPPGPPRRRRFASRLRCPR